MIFYRRTTWYGLNYMIKLKGTLLLQMLPAMVLSGGLAGALSAVYDMDDDDEYLWADLFHHPYAFQVFGIVFGYMCILRLNISYNRYWEGVSQVKVMYSKWTDACLQILAFDCCEHGVETLQEDSFSVAIVQLFKQMSALAVMKLHATDFCDSIEAEVEAENHEFEMMFPTDGRATALTSGAGSKMKRQPSLTVASMQEVVRRSEAMKPEDWSVTFDAAERDFMMTVPDKVHAQVSRINRNVTTRHKCGGLPIPAPILSRVFQEISNGVAAFNAASKLKQIPVPFALVHFNALLLLLFNAFCPVVIAAFTRNVWMSVVMSVVASGGFSALWLVANELEDPFGTDANDMPMMGFHKHFCEHLALTLASPWMLKDQWINDGNTADRQKKGEQPRKTIRRRSAEPSAFPKWEGPTDSPSATPGPSATLEVAAVMVTASPKGSPSVTREAVDAESSGLREVSHGRGPSENAGATE